MKDGFVPVHTRSETIALKKDEIIYAESQLRLIIIHTAAREYKYYGKLSELLELLGEPFYKCHSSLVINMDKLVSVSNCVLKMEGGTGLILGRNKYQEARRRFIDYLNESCEEVKKRRSAKTEEAHAMQPPIKN